MAGRCRTVGGTAKTVPPWEVEEVAAKYKTESAAELLLSRLVSTFLSKRYGNYFEKTMRFFLLKLMRKVGT